jgi:hypothetical protein
VRYFFLSLCALVILYTSAGYGQVRILGSNSLRLGSGETDNGAFMENKRYLEEIANARLFYEGITLGLRYELSDPSEVGPNFQGIRRRWIEYQKDELSLQAGHTNALYGRGLTINMFESRPLNYDSWVDGISGSYEYKFSKEQTEIRPSIDARFVAGNLDFIDIDSTKPIQHIKSQAVNGNVGLFNKKLNLGVAFVQAFTNVNRELPSGTKTTSRETDQPEFNLSFITDHIEGFFGFTEMRSRLTQVDNRPDSLYRKGQALYGSLSYSSDVLGIVSEYKDYRYYVHKPGEKDEDYLSKLPISSPPEVYKDFTYTSITRTTHAVNFDDELGFQLESIITAIEHFNIDLYGAASSRHNGYSDSLGSDGLPTIIGSVSGLPEFKNPAFYPFWELFSEVEYDFGDLNYVKLFGHRRSDVTAASGSIADTKRSTTVGTKLQFQTTKNQSLLTSFEYQWMFDSQREANDHQLNNILFIAQYSFNPLITFGGQYDFSTWYEQGKHIWPQAFMSVRVGSAHTVLVSYGDERGGLNCTGGICRIVPAFSGLRFSITSQL